MSNFLAFNLLSHKNKVNQFRKPFIKLSISFKLAFFVEIQARFVNNQILCMQRQDVSLVLDFRTYLRSKKRSEFTLTQLADYMACTPFGSSKRVKNEILAMLANDCANLQLPLAYMLPVKQSERAIGANTKLVYKEHFIRKQLYKPGVLNGNQLTRYFQAQLPVFYNSEYRKHELLQQPLALMNKIAESLNCVLQPFIAESGRASSFRFAIPKLYLPENFFQYIHLLPFIDPQSLMADKSLARQFFAQLYNIMRLHLFIVYCKLHNGKECDASNERSAFFSQYSYNVAGNNFSLDDVKYNILKCRKPLKPSEEKGSQGFMSIFICSKPQASKAKPFCKNDYRNRLVCGDENTDCLDLLHSGSLIQKLQINKLSEIRRPHSLSKTPKHSLRTNHTSLSQKIPGTSITNKSSCSINESETLSGLLSHKKYMRSIF